MDDIDELHAPWNMTYSVGDLRVALEHVRDTLKRSLEENRGHVPLDEAQQVVDFASGFLRGY